MESFIKQEGWQSTCQSACNFHIKIARFCTVRALNIIHLYFKSQTQPQNKVDTLFLVRITVLQRVTIIICRNSPEMHLSSVCTSIESVYFVRTIHIMIIARFVGKITCSLANF